MTSSPNGGVFSACLLLVCGAPGSGKTLLAKTLAGDCGKARSAWHWAVVHFDDFYPVDMRVKQNAGAQDIFDLKQARSFVKQSLEALLSKNVTCGGGQTVEDTKSVADLVSHLNTCETIFEDDGRYACGSEKVVFVLDDNMYLRSMRHEYYQLARSYHLGFAEVFVTCPLAVALDRNSQRSIPIPESTIVAMDLKMELPKPAVLHWEKLSMLIDNSTDDQSSLIQQCEGVMKLVEEAMHNPVPPLTPMDSDLQETSRSVNLENCIHQADHILRKCVSNAVQSAPQGMHKSAVAREANRIRKKLLEDVRSGAVASDGGESWDCSQGLDHMARVINDAFQNSINHIID